ncbi:MAG: RHS repeat-associated core domain-containing protein [Cyclobacteriaceae bacterium]
MTPDTQYEYDALYRLLNATGRQMVGLATPSNSDVAIQTLTDATATALELYTQSYQYDEMGNILQMAHTANSGNWNKYYHYNDPTNPTNNYLLGTSNSATPAVTNHYTYDAHGNMEAMPHLTSMEWDYSDRLQSADLGGGGDVYYTYDASGNRVRKVIENGNITEERIYLGDYEVYRKTANSTLDTERETLHISDNTGRIALADTLTVDAGSTVSTPTPLIRYQLSNHLGSATLELDDVAAIISYEEYHPFGSTSYRSGRNSAETSLKRYRYVGKERDDETGLYFYGARYYAAWLARFVSVDPLKDDYPYYTSYQYAGNKPVTFIDLDGLEEASPPLLQLQRQFQSFLKQQQNKPKPTNPLKEPVLQKSDNTRHTAIDKRAALIQSDVDRKQAFEQQKQEFANGNFSSLLNAPSPRNTGTIKAASLRHPGVDRQSFQMATQDRVFQSSAIALFAAGTAVVAGEVIATESFKKVFQTKIEKVAAGIAKDVIGQLAVNEGDITKVDFANAIASGFVKNNTLKNLIASAVDYDVNGLDTSKYEDAQGLEKIGQEFLIRQLADGIFNSYKDQAGSNLPKGFNADLVLDVVKKEFRNLTNQGIDKTQEAINRKIDEQKRE